MTDYRKSEFSHLSAKFPQSSLRRWPVALIGTTLHLF
jgi:hypothetical protein